MINVYVLEPLVKHLYTIIMLHGMYSDYKSLIIKAKKIQKSFKNMKIIIPNSPKRTIHWPNGIERSVNAWYDYYTNMNGEMEHDDINIKQFNIQTKRIIKIINKEKALVGENRIILYGVSQGGTLCFNIFLKNYIKISCFIGIHTCLMDNIIDTKNLKKTLQYKYIYLFSGTNDNIYLLKLQEKSVKHLYKNYVIEWHIEKNLEHCEYSKMENKYIINCIKQYINL